MSQISLIFHLITYKYIRCVHIRTLLAAGQNKSSDFLSSRVGRTWGRPTTRWDFRWTFSVACSRSSTWKLIRSVPPRILRLVPNPVLPTIGTGLLPKELHNTQYVYKYWGTANSSRERTRHERDKERERKKERIQWNTTFFIVSFMYISWRPKSLLMREEDENLTFVPW